VRGTYSKKSVLLLASQTGKTGGGEQELLANIAVRNQGIFVVRSARELENGIIVFINSHDSQKSVGWG